MNVDLKKAFEYENGFYLTAPVTRFSKFVSHLDFFRQTDRLPGAIVECGVFKGASLMRWIKFRSLLTNPWSRKIIAFDTFGKFPPASCPLDEPYRARFVAEAGEDSVAEDDFERLLNTQGLQENVQLVAGDVCQTVPDYISRHPDLKISLLHIDVDLYEPTRVCLASLFDHVVRNGIVILDDYEAFPGAANAIDQFFANRREVIAALPYSHRISFVKKAYPTTGG